MRFPDIYPGKNKTRGQGYKPMDPPTRKIRRVRIENEKSPSRGPYVYVATFKNDSNHAVTGNPFIYQNEYKKDKNENEMYTLTYFFSSCFIQIFISVNAQYVDTEDAVKCSDCSIGTGKQSGDQGDNKNY